MIACLRFRDDSSWYELSLSREKQKKKQRIEIRRISFFSLKMSESLSRGREKEHTRMPRDDDDERLISPISATAHTFEHSRIANVIKQCRPHTLGTSTYFPFFFFSFLSLSYSLSLRTQDFSSLSFALSLSLCLRPSVSLPPFFSTH